MYNFIPIIIIIICVIIYVIIYVIMYILNNQSKKQLSKKTNDIICFRCVGIVGSEYYTCKTCNKSWCKHCIDFATPKGKYDWVLGNNLSNECYSCRPIREESLSRPICFSCDTDLDKKISQCKSCYKTYCKSCKYESLTATNNKCIYCAKETDDWQRKTSSKPICISCDTTIYNEKLHQCSQCNKTYCNYKINNDICLSCVIII